MNSPDVFDIITSIIAAIFWIVMFYLWVSFRAEVKERLNALEKIATRQTELLDAIAVNTLPAEERATVRAERAAQAARQAREREAWRESMEMSSRREWRWFWASAAVLILIGFMVYFGGRP